MRNVRGRKLIGIVGLVVVCMAVVAGALPKFPPPPPFFRHVPHTLASRSESPVSRPFESDRTLTANAPPQAHVTFLQADPHAVLPRMRPRVPASFALNTLKKFPYPPHGRPMRPFFTLRFAGNLLLLPTPPNFERLFQMPANLLDQPLSFDPIVMARTVPVSAAYITSPSPSALQVFTL